MHKMMIPWLRIQKDLAQGLAKLRGEVSSFFSDMVDDVDQSRLLCSLEQVEKNLSRTYQVMGERVYNYLMTGGDTAMAAVVKDQLDQIKTLQVDRDRISGELKSRTVTEE